MELNPLAVTVLVALVAFVAGYAVGRRRAGGSRVVWQSTTPDLPAGAEVEELVRRGQKIEAIRRYRELHGAGLKEAKDAVERVQAAQRPPHGQVRASRVRHA